jgi:hypothetical protein
VGAGGVLYFKGEIMNRTDFERAVWDSDLNPHARLVLLTYAGASDYRDVDQEVWPSKATVSHRTGLHPDTVKKYVDALVKDGWLIPSKGYGRAQGFHLAAGVVTQRQVMDRSRASNLSPNGQETQSPNGQETNSGRESEVSPNGQDVSPNGAVSLSPNGAGVSPNGQELITKNNHIEQPKKNQREDSQAHPPFDEYKERWKTPGLTFEERIESYLLTKYGPGTGLNRGEIEEVRSLTSTATWGGYPFEEAVEKIYANQGKGWDEW